MIGSVPIVDAELNAARRRAMFVLAAGGDPHRELDLDSVAVAKLAADLDTLERRDALAAGLGALDADGLLNVSGAVELLLSEPEAAWRIFSLALLADELAEE